MTSACIIGIRGYSDSGKTTLIEKALPELKRAGLYVGVLKHAHHGLKLDSDDKDTSKFYKAGADFIFAHDPGQGFARCRCAYDDIWAALNNFPSGLDLILVEGHKHAEIPHIRLVSKTDANPKPADSNETNLLDRDDPQYVERFLEFVHAELKRQFSERRVRAGLLIGGKSSRMGTAKHLLEIGGETLLERSFRILSSVAEKTLLLGSADMSASPGTADRLPDVNGSQGPMAGMLGAFRWDPESSWIISSVDMPFMNEEAWRWLLAQRRPGVWAVMPRINANSPAETTGACYEPMIFEEFESLRRKGIFKLQQIVSHPKVICPIIPEHLAHAWTNVNTPEEWKKAIAASVQRERT